MATIANSHEDLPVDLAAVPAGDLATLSRTAFATLRPVNALAKMAFSNIRETRMGYQQHALPSHMLVEPELRHDPDVRRFRLEVERARETSESLTDPDTDAESQAGGDAALGMIWSGCYVFALETPPSAPDMGWSLGRGPAEKTPNPHDPHSDMLLTTRAFAKEYGIPVRTFHARFNFAKDTAAFFLASILTSPRAELSVNGMPVGREMHVLNQHSMRIRLGSLEYAFEYTGFSATDDFFQLRRGYIVESLKGPPTTCFDMPTPRREVRTTGRWTLAHPLGKGAEGRVFLASSAKNEVVAIKMIERKARTADRVNAEISMYREVTELARDDEDGQRIVRLKETIYPGGEEQYSPGSVFDEVALVLEPMAPQTLSNIVKAGNHGYAGFLQSLLRV
jgi:hypothetical protein